jgi:arabinogalactan endo-1,4-beta-galactosidase
MTLAMTVLILCVSLSPVDAQQTEAFALGADISWIQQRENNGVRYYHNNNSVDPFEVLRDHGFNYIRLRLFVDPTASVPGEPESPYSSTNAASASGSADALKPYCGLDSTIKMAKRVKAAGMKFLLDFHYSDTWTDPAKQHIPMSWRSLATISQLTAKVREYTRESLEKFKDEGVLPDMVQIGNENVSGMLWPIGRNYISGGQGGRANFAALINAGIDGVKDVSGDIKIMAHTINERDPNGWLSNLITDGVSRINVLGLSYYSEWHGTPDSLERVANAFAANSRFNGIKFCVVEYADNHRRVNDIVYGMPADKRFGTFVWEPFDWREVLFDWKSGANSGRHSNQRLQLYPQMADDYGINTSTAVKNDYVKARERVDFHINKNGIINYYSNTPGAAAIYTLQGRIAGRFVMGTPGVYDPSLLLKNPPRSGAYILAVDPVKSRTVITITR